MSEVSATVGSLEGGGGESHLSTGPTPACGNVLSATMCSEFGTSSSPPAAPYRRAAMADAQARSADAVWWSAAGTGERSPILLDGALMNAASSVLPMVPPCSFKPSLLSVCRVLCFSFTGATGGATGWGGGHFPFSTVPTSLSLTACRVVYVLFVHRWRR